MHLQIPWVLSDLTSKLLIWPLIRLTSELLIWSLHLLHSEFRISSLLLTILASKILTWPRHIFLSSKLLILELLLANFLCVVLESVVHPRILLLPRIISLSLIKSCEDTIVVRWPTWVVSLYALSLWPSSISLNSKGVWDVLRFSHLLVSKVRVLELKLVVLVLRSSNLARLVSWHLVKLLILVAHGIALLASCKWILLVEHRHVRNLLIIHAHI